MPSIKSLNMDDMKKIIVESLIRSGDISITVMKSTNNIRLEDFDLRRNVKRKSVRLLGGESYL